ncbi:MAG: LysR family transcriptional regulator [Chloroflexota bacterium]|nr:LysR family transcriptional regulator [Chloroflexota bacterium]
MQVEARLRAFAALARRGSFSAAAEELVISQPAVSKHVADLEAELGTKLVTRGARRAELTRAGAFVAEYVLRAEAILAQAGRGVATIDGELVGRLAVGASGNGMYLIPRALALYHRAHPAVALDVIMVGTTAEIVEAVRAHRVEIGVVGAAAAPDLEAERLVEDEIVVVAAPALAKRRLTSRAAEELTWIAREEGSATRAAVEAAWRDLGISPKRRLSFPSWEGVKLTVAEGLGVTAISRHAVEVELAAGTLALVRLPGWKVRRHLSLVHSRDVPLTPVGQRFVEALRAAWTPSRRGEQASAASRTRLGGVATRGAIRPKH